MAKVFRPIVNIQPQTVSTGAVQQQLGLADKLDNFASFTAGIAAEKTIATASASGQQAAAQLQTGQKPEFKEETFIGGVAKKAYNTALRSSYVASVDRDMTLGLSALKTEHSNDLVSFNDSAAALIKGVTTGVDPASRQLVLESANNFMDSARIEVQKNTIQKEMADADEALILSGEFFGQEANVFAFNGDNLSSSESLTKIFNVNQSRVEAGQISPAQSAILNDDAVQAARVAKNRGELSGALQLDNGIEIASKAIVQMIEKPLKGMSLEQNDALVSTLNSDLNQFISLQNKQETADQVTLTARQNNNFSQLLVGMAEGNLNQNQLNEAAKRGDVSGSQFDKLTTKLSAQGVGVTDATLELGIQLSITDGNDETSTIIENMGSHLTQVDAGILLKMQAEYADEESVLNQNSTRRARSFMRDSMKITGILGNLTDDAAKKTAASVREFDARVLAGEDAFAVADDLYDRDTLIKLESNAANQGFKIDDALGAINTLQADTAAAVKNAKGNPTQVEELKNRYNRQLELLQQIQALQQSQNGFDKSLKELK